MRRPNSALTTAILGTALTASTLLAQNDPTPAEPPGVSPMAAARGARHLLRNGWDYITYQEYERALAYFREAETRKFELGESELLSLRQGIARAQQGMREATNTTIKPYARSGNRRPGAFALARPAQGADLAPVASEPIQLTSGTADARATMQAAGMDQTSANVPIPPPQPTPIALAPAPPAPASTDPAPVASPPPSNAPAPGNGSPPTLPDLPALPPVPPIDPPPVPETVARPAAPARSPAPPAMTLETVPPLPDELRTNPARPEPSSPEPDVRPATTVEPTPSPAETLVPPPLPDSAPAPDPASTPDQPSSPTASQDKEPVSLPAPAPTPAPAPVPSVAPAPVSQPLPANTGTAPMVLPPDGPIERPAASPAAAVRPAPAPAAEAPPRRVAVRPAAPPPRLASAQPYETFIPNRSEVSGSTLTPELQRQVERIAQRQEEDLKRGTPPASEMPDVPVATPTAPSTRLEISRAPSPTEARPIRAIPVPEEFVPLPPRDWAPNRKYWAAAAPCHMPLYFQDAALERYGHTTEQFFGPIGRFLTYPVDDPTQSNQRNQLVQPFVSAGLFFAQIALLPYNLVMDPPWEAEYDLGYYRPGDRIPTDLYYLPLSGVGPPLHGSRY